MIKELEVTTQEPLEERQMVWALESYIPGRLCVWGKGGQRMDYIIVCRSERDALDLISRGSLWMAPTTGVKPIELSLESVIQQAREQAPSPVWGYPCAGFVWVPEMEFVEVPR